MSLWQGVDVPGDACQLVVIDRLPFPRPDEPLAAARRGASTPPAARVLAVSAPLAAVRLAQGVGPADPVARPTGGWSRCSTRGWRPRGTAAFLRKSLPPFWYTTDREVVLGALGRLFGKGRRCTLGRSGVKPDRPSNADCLRYLLAVAFPATPEVADVSLVAGEGVLLLFAPSASKNSSPHATSEPV